MQPLPITLDHVHLSKAGRVILCDVTARLSAQRIGILGRNGSGKTSLLRLIAGLERPDQGEVRLGAHDPARARRLMLAEVGILFQNPDHQILFPTVIEELSFGLIQQGLSRAEAEARAERALSEEGRLAWRDVHCHRLSQGQRQYLCLLALLLMGPGTLLLDEPFAGLDLPTAQRLTRRLAGLSQRLVQISHDPASLWQADQILWLDQGRIRADGPPDQVIPDFMAEMQRLGGQDADLELAP